MRITCVGAGPGGLFLAILMKLQDPRHEVTVLERNRAGVSYGWGVGFWGDLLADIQASDEGLGVQAAQSARPWLGHVLAIDGREPVRIAGDGYGLGRHHLLEMLTKRATGLGVEIRYETDVISRDQLAGADLIVAADGVNSRLRQAQREAFGTRIVSGGNRHAWLGARKVSENFTFAFADTPAGWVWTHAYPFDEHTSTMIVECSEETCTGLGLDALRADDCLGLLERLFASYLDGAPMLRQAQRDEPGARMDWSPFRTVTNERWHDGNLVLLGDAAHTTHFSIGSGTRLAIQDAIALAARLREHDDLSRALAAYEQERRVGIRRTQSEARLSAAWFEHVPRYMHLDTDTLYSIIRMRRSVLLPHLPPRAYHRLQQAAHALPGLRQLRAWTAPKARSAYDRRASRA